MAPQTRKRCPCGRHLYQCLRHSDLRHICQCTDVPRMKLAKSCRTCRPHYFCSDHGRYKATCNEDNCSGGNYCRCGSGKRKAVCEDCCGASRCDLHNKLPCRECHKGAYLIKAIRGSVLGAMKRTGLPKTDHTETLLGCTLEFYKAHLQSLFEPGMAWDNFGKGPGRRWNIDHIFPLRPAWEPPPTGEQIRERCKWANTQPLWYEDNMAKGNRWVGGAKPINDAHLR